MPPSRQIDTTIGLKGPIRKDHQYNGLTGLLIGQDVVYGAPGQTKTFDLSLPMRLTQRQQPDILQNLTGTLLVVSAPLFVPEFQVVRAKRLPQDFVSQTEIQLIGQDVIYADPGQVPTFGQLPNPRGPAYPTSLRIYIYDEPLRDLIGQDIIYGAPGETVNPNLPNPRGYVYPISLRTWESDEVSNNLLGQDVMYGDPGQVPTRDIPNPLRPERLPVLTDYVPPDTLYAVVETPFGFVDLSLPRIAKRGNQDWIAPTETQLIGQDRIYADPGEVPVYYWYAPWGKQYPTSLRTYVDQELTETLFGTELPKVQSWDILPPKGQPYPLDLRTYAYDQPLKNLIGEDIVPGEITEWIVPKGQRFAVPREWLQNHLEDTLLSQDQFYGAPGQVPTFGQVPNPWGKPFPISNRTYAYDEPLRDLIGQDTVPGEITEWIVPKGYPFAIPLRNWQQDHVTDTLLGQDIIYSAPGEVPTYDWPVPKGPGRMIDLRTWVQDEPLKHLIGQDQIYDGPGKVPMYEWPVTHDFAREQHLVARSAHDWIWQDGQGTFLVPSSTVLPNGVQLVVMRVPDKARNPQDWQHRSDVQLIGQDTVYGDKGQVPTYDTQLPPARKVPPLSNRTHLYDEPLRDLIGQDQFYGGAGQVPTFGEIPNPWGKPYPQDLRWWESDELNGNLLGQDTFYGAPGEVPARDLTQPVRPATRRQSDVVQTFLGNFVNVPFGPFDLLLPIRSKPQTRDYIRPTDIQLIGQDTVYGAPGEAPNYNLPLPPKGYPYPIWLRTLIDKHVTDTLRGQDTIYGDPGQVPTVSLPNPLRGPPKRIDDFIGSIIAGLNIRLPEGMQQLPARLVLPLARLRPDLILPAQVQLIGQDRIYAGPGQVLNYNLPNPPRGYPFPLDLRTDLNTYRLLIGQDIIYSAPGEVPVYEWPVPKGRPYPLDLRTLFGRFVRAGLIRVEATLDASLDIVVLKFADYTPILVRDVDGNIVTILDASEETRRIFEIGSDDEWPR